jgi:hypothetical protein
VYDERMEIYRNLCNWKMSERLKAELLHGWVLQQYLKGEKAFFVS